jgi:hypothetical protein
MLVNKESSGCMLIKFQEYSLSFNALLGRLFVSIKIPWSHFDTVHLNQAKYHSLRIFRVNRGLLRCTLMEFEEYSGFLSGNSPRVEFS